LIRQTKLKKSNIKLSKEDRKLVDFLWVDDDSGNDERVMELEEEEKEIFEDEDVGEGWRRLKSRDSSKEPKLEKSTEKKP
jgi:hypothetical protein